MKRNLNWLILILLVPLVVPTLAHGQGRLSAVRSKVKSAPAPKSHPPAQPKSKPKSKPKNSQRQSGGGKIKLIQSRRTSNQSHTKPVTLAHPRSRAPRRNNRGSLRGYFYAPPRPPVVQNIRVYQSVVEPVPVIVAPAPTIVATPTPAVEPQLIAPAIVSEPAVEEMPVWNGEYDHSVPNQTSHRVAGESLFKASPNDWISRFTITGGSDFGGLGQGGIDWLLQAPEGIGVQTNVTMFRESGASFRDHLWIGDVNLVYEPVTGDLRGRFGIGLNWLGDRFGGDVGLNLTAGFDLLITEKTFLTGEVDFGTLGDSDFLNSQITLGRRIGSAEIFGGYRHLDIGGVELGGVIAGLRFRL